MNNLLSNFYDAFLLSNLKLAKVTTVDAVKSKVKRDIFKDKIAALHCIDWNRVLLMTTSAAQDKKSKKDERREEKRARW